MTVVGPELPLSLGIVDEFQRRGLRVFGPRAAAARLESSKIFAKEFMQRHNIPTAHYAICTSEKDIKDALPHFGTPIVVKADGLAAGKGVVIAKTREEAGTVALQMLQGKMLGEAGTRVVLEEFLQGDEVSFLAICDGERAIPLAAAQDHKRIGDNDTGPNTGGMGAYSTPQLLDAAMREWILAHIARPVVQAMKSEGSEYRGILYCGLMMTARGPMVLEFNCRFGDPETQPILMRLDSDLLGAFIASAEGRLSEGDLKWSNDSAACVVMASKGYPDTPELGKVIHGLKEADQVPGVKVFHAGTRHTGDAFVTNGGRVLGVTARGADLRMAVDRAYEAVGEISFDGMQYRRDIAQRGLRGK
jgi:phosphoribosylamine--glycine ligase